MASRAAPRVGVSRRGGVPATVDAYDGLSRSPCILVVEDDAPTRTFLADNLTADGYELLVAGSVRDALRQVEYHHVDLAVVDVGLPDGSGLDVVAAVRAATGAGARLDARLPIVLLSGRAADIDVRGFERGADDFVPKRSASVVSPSRRTTKEPSASTRSMTSGSTVGTST